MSANILHPTLQTAQVETSFDDGRPSDAEHDASQEVERQVRDLAGDVDYWPVVLMQATLAPAIGPLSHRRARIRALLSMPRMFMKSFMTSRPDVHRAAAPDDEAEAVDGVLLADLLAGELARIAERLGSAFPDVPLAPSSTRPGRSSCPHRWPGGRPAPANKPRRDPSRWPVRVHA